MYIGCFRKENSMHRESMRDKDSRISNGICFTRGGSGMIGVFNTDQETAIAKLKEQTEIDEESCYIFLVPNVTAKKADDTPDVVSGYMPRGYRYGFIYNELSNIRTIAHEICHGAFHMAHTFAEGDSYIAPEGQTDNLMDYTSTGTTLNHWQWQEVHDLKAVRFKWLQKEKEGEIITRLELFRSRGIVYMSEIWNQKYGSSEGDSEIPQAKILSGIYDKNLLNAINCYLCKTKEFQIVKTILESKKCTIRIICRNTIEESEVLGSSSILNYDIKQESKYANPIYDIKSLQYDNVIRDSNNYYLVLNVHIYPEAFNEVGSDDDDKSIAMAITLGHELFIHYHFIDAIDSWQKGKYKEALENAKRNTGPNNGDFDHKDYIMKNVNVSGIKKMYNYLD